jgi:hypothetical protein
LKICWTCFKRSRADIFCVPDGAGTVALLAVVVLFSLSLAYVESFGTPDDEVMVLLMLGS